MIKAVSYLSASVGKYDFSGQNRPKHSPLSPHSPIVAHRGSSVARKQEPHRDVRWTRLAPSPASASDDRGVAGDVTQHCDRACARRDKPFPSVGEDIRDEALATLVVKKLPGGAKVAAVKTPGFGEPPQGRARRHRVKVTLVPWAATSSLFGVGKGVGEVDARPVTPWPWLEAWAFVLA